MRFTKRTCVHKTCSHEIAHDNRYLFNAGFTRVPEEVIHRLTAVPLGSVPQSVTLGMKSSVVFTVTVPEHACAGLSDTLRVDVSWTYCDFISNWLWLFCKVRSLYSTLFLYLHFHEFPHYAPASHLPNNQYTRSINYPSLLHHAPLRNAHLLLLFG